jgi:heme/copper-type cytochrome/quinol oxidase subunit 2
MIFILIYLISFYNSYMEDSPTINNNVSFYKKVTTIDDEQKDSLMNGIQYVAMAAIPVALADIFIMRFFEDKEPEKKGTVELLAEILAQVVLTIILMFCIHKVIIAIPTYSGKAMNRINYTSLSLGMLFGLFAFKHNIRSKIDVVFNRLIDMWEGKKEEKKETKKDKSKVSVSQPISGRQQLMPTHTPSRADYLGTQNQNSMMPVAQPTQQVHQEIDVTSQQNYGGPQNNLIDANLPTMEPMAANDALGGSSWSSW